MKYFFGAVKWTVKLTRKKIDKMSSVFKKTFNDKTPFRKEEEIVENTESTAWPWPKKKYSKGKFWRNRRCGGGKRGCHGRKSSRAKTGLFGL